VFPKERYVYFLEAGQLPLLVWGLRRFILYVFTFIYIWKVMCFFFFTICNTTFSLSKIWDFFFFVWSTFLKDMSLLRHKRLDVTINKPGKYQIIQTSLCSMKNRFFFGILFQNKSLNY